MKTIEFTWDDIRDALSFVDLKENRIYGVPNGGMIACTLLRKAKFVTDIMSANIILDDIVGSGRTRDYYYTHYPAKQFIGLFDKTIDASIQEVWVSFPWEREHPGLKPESIDNNITRMIEYIGENPNREGLLKTPERVIRSYQEIFAGYNQKPEDLFTVFEPDGYNQIILLKNIELYSMCEHHMLPFFGKAHVAYIPGQKIIGISKLARLVDMFARRLQIQERIGQQVTDVLNEFLKPIAAACIIEADHLCMRMRGCNKQNSILVTSSLTGAFLDEFNTRTELFNLINKGA